MAERVGEPVRRLKPLAEAGPLFLYSSNRGLKSTNSSRGLGDVMATLAPSRSKRRPMLVRDARFYLISAALMWLVLALGFGNAFAQGRSSFGEPAIVHVHAAIFVSWTALYLLQTGLAATGSLAPHRRLGWLSLAWLPAMVVMGTWITVRSIRQEGTPFFFTPGYFLILNPLTVLTFAALSGAGIVLRRRTQWHRRLMMSGMAVLTGPGWGRFTPAPLLVPYTGEALIALILLFPLAGVIRDWRVDGRVHPAWWWGIAAVLALEATAETLPHTSVGRALYAIAMRGAPAAAHDLNVYPPFPPGFPVRHP